MSFKPKNWPRVGDKSSVQHHTAIVDCVNLLDQVASDSYAEKGMLTQMNAKKRYIALTETTSDNSPPERLVIIDTAQCSMFRLHRLEIEPVSCEGIDTALVRPRFDREYSSQLYRCSFRCKIFSRFCSGQSFLDLPSFDCSP